MSIIIPSKNIYSKENPKVANNLIQKIEFEEQNSSLVNKNGEIVYFKDFDLTGEKTNIPISNKFVDTREVVVKENQYQDAIAYILKASTGFNGFANLISFDKVVLPRISENKYIKNIYSSNDKPIKIDIEYEKSEYHWVTKYDNIMDEFDYTPQTNNIKSSTVYNYSGIDYDIKIGQQAGDDQPKFDTDSYWIKNSDISHQIRLNKIGTMYQVLPYTSLKTTIVWGEEVEFNVTASVSEIAHTNEPRVTINNDKIFIELYYGEQKSNFIYDLDIVFCSTAVVDKKTLPIKYHDAIATRLVLKCKRITLTVYGDTEEIISIPISRTIGDEDSHYAYRHPSNNLIQSSNIYESTDENGNTISQKSNDFFLGKLLDEYKSGKEGATLRCSIGEYYESIPLANFTQAMLSSSLQKVTNGARNTYILNIGTKPLQIALQSYDSANNWISHLIIKSLEKTGSIFLKFQKTDDFSRLGIRVFDSNDTYNAVILNVNHLQNGEYTVCINIVSLSDNYLSFEVAYIHSSTPLVSTKYEHKPMVFEIGDKCIPYIYNSYGQETPMSMHKDGSPKEFRVLGTKNFYDGAVWQELYLQEV